MIWLISNLTGSMEEIVISFHLNQQLKNMQQYLDTKYIESI